LGIQEIRQMAGSHLCEVLPAGRSQDLPGDALRKQGDRSSSRTTAWRPQDGTMNATYSGGRGALMVAINQLLLQVIGRRHLTWRGAAMQVLCQRAKELEPRRIGCIMST
jgi:hypothetical protein